MQVKIHEYLKGQEARVKQCACVGSRFQNCIQIQVRLLKQSKSRRCL